MDLEHEKRLTEVESRSKSNMRRIDEMEKRQDSLEELTSTVKVLADREKRVEDDVSEIKDDVKEMKLKPGKKWEGLIEKVIMTVVGILLGYLASQMGLN